MATKCVLGYTYASGADGLLPEKWAEKGPEKPAHMLAPRALRTTAESREGHAGRMRPWTI